jgi:hypothetical protein
MLTTADTLATNTVTGGTLGTAERPQVFRFYNALSRKVGNACIDVIVADSGGHVDVGVYSVSGTALTLQWHTGSLSTTNTGNVCATPTAYTMGSGTYYVAWCMDNTTASLSSFQDDSQWATMAAGTGAVANTAGVNSTDTCSSGVLPNSMTTTNIVNTTSNLSVPVAYMSN